MNGYVVKPCSMYLATAMHEVSITAKAAQFDPQRLLYLLVLQRGVRHPLSRQSRLMIHLWRLTYQRQSSIDIQHRMSVHLAQTLFASFLPLTCSQRDSMNTQLPHKMPKINLNKVGQVRHPLPKTCGTSPNMEVNTEVSGTATVDTKRGKAWRWT